MTPDQAIQSLSEKFKSGNSVDVTRATITREEYDAILIGMNKEGYIKEYLADSEYLAGVKAG